MGFFQNVGEPRNEACPKNKNKGSSKTEREIEREIEREKENEHTQTLSAIVRKCSLEGLC
jgi:hypothetical protein